MLEGSVKAGGALRHCLLPVEFCGLQGLPVLEWQSQTGIESVTPKGVLLPTVCDVSATHEGS